MQCLRFPCEDAVDLNSLQQGNSGKRPIKIPCIERMHIGNNMEFVLFLMWLNSNGALCQVQASPLKIAEIS